MSTTKPDHVPERLHAVTPYLCCKGAADAIAWYSEIFDATPASDPIIGPSGEVGHAEIQIGDSVVMISDEWPEGGVFSPLTRGSTSVSLVVYVGDVDDVFARALAAGATEERPVADQFHGSRAGWLVDPYGHRWNVGTPIEHLSQASPEAVATNGSAAGNLGYFTIGIPDAGRAKAFYGGLFGWDFEGGSLDEGYHIPNVSPPGGLLGGQEQPTFTIYFRVDDMEAAVTRVQELGGVAEAIRDYPSGLNAPCQDDQGTRFELWQPAPGY